MRLGRTIVDVFYKRIASMVISGATVNSNTLNRNEIATRDLHSTKIEQLHEM